MSTSATQTHHEFHGKLSELSDERIGQMARIGIGDLLDTDDARLGRVMRKALTTLGPESLDAFYQSAREELDASESAAVTPSVHSPH